MIDFVAILHFGSVLKDVCIVNPKCEVFENEILESGTVVFGEQNEHLDISFQMDSLRIVSSKMKD